MSKVYEATAAREGGWWVIHVPELDVSGQARKLAKVEEAAQEIVALALDAEVADVKVTVRTIADDAVVQALSQADALAEQGQALAAKAARLRADTVRNYVKSEGLTVREAGTLLGMSPARVQQLVKG